MKILLLQAYLGKKEEFIIYPLGLDYLATLLTGKGHDVKIFDFNTSDNPFDRFPDELTAFMPDCIGLSLRNIDNQLRIDPFYYYPYFRKTLKTVRRLLKRTVIVVGGAGFSMYPEKIMRRNPEIDFGMYLEAEESFPELIDTLDGPEGVPGIFYRKNGTTVFSGNRKLPDFKRLPHPRRTFCDLSPYLNHPQSIGVQTKRGCPRHCTYCNYRHLNGNRLRMRSPSHVVDEIAYLMDTFGVTHIMFSDALFNLPVSHAAGICREIIKRKLPITWSAYMDIQGADREFMLLLKKAGCNMVCFSPDAVSQGALDGLKKGLKTKDVHESLKLFTRDPMLADMGVIYCLFLNPPGETFSGLLNTVLFYLKAKWLLRGRGGAMINWIRMEPNIRMLKEAVENGVVQKGLELLPENKSDIDKTFYSNPPQNRIDFILIFLFRAKIVLVKLLKKCFGYLDLLSSNKRLT